MIPLISASQWKAGEPCAVVGMIDSTYRAKDGLTQSELNRFAQSPALFRYVEVEQTEAMRHGHALHSLLLENRKEYVVRPETYGPDEKPWHGGAKECKEWNAANADRLILSADEADALECAVRHAQTHELVNHLLTGAHTELSVFGATAAGLTWGKGRMDAVNFRGDRVQVVDIKKTQDARLSAFSRTILQRGYHIQAAWYRRLIRQFVEKTILHEHWLVAVEIDPIPRVNVWKLAPEAIDYADAEIDKLLDTLADCRATGRWPDYHDKDVGLMGTIDLPRWVYGDEEQLTGLTVGGAA